jgi:uncharacterized protein YukE
MIQIHNLSQYEIDMLDHMWTLETEEEYFEWYYLLDTQDQKLADYLQEMVILATAEETIEETGYKEAKAILNKFAL